jgi:GNAT superfamily N-acetyltransferase
VTCRVALLSPAHDRTCFRSGVPALDRYLTGQAGRDVARAMSAVFVLVTPANKVAGYYALAPATVYLPGWLGDTERPGLRYPPVPAARLARLAVDRRHRRQGHGRALLADALHRTRRHAAGALALVADTADETAREFYAHAGFLALADQRRMFRPLAGLGEDSG